MGVFGVNIGYLAEVLKKTMSLKFCVKGILVLGLSFILVDCRNQSKTSVDPLSAENDTLIPFVVDLVKKMDNKIQWERMEYDSLAFQTVKIHRPICSISDKNEFVESVEDIDLLKYFTKEELSRPKHDSLDIEIIKRYNSIGGRVIEVDYNMIKYWYEESDRLLSDNPNAVIPPSFQWYFSVSEPVLSKDEKYIYFEFLECNNDKEAFWVYVFKKENTGWKRFYVKRIGVKIA